jgi:hypothetical protein
LFIDQIETAIGAASGARALDDISRMIWRGLADGLLDDADAQRLADAIHARRMAAKAAGMAQDGRERLCRWSHRLASRSGLLHAPKRSNDVVALLHPAHCHRRSLVASP